MSEKLSPADVIARLEAWLLSWIVFPHPEYQPLIVALWAAHTWIYETFDISPRLIISGTTKESGKSALLATTASLCRNPEELTDVTKAGFFRLIDQTERQSTFLLDESEPLKSEVHPLRPALNVGYQQGGSVPRTMPGGRVDKFNVFAPLAGALIGDVYDTLRSRSIMIYLAQSRNVPRRYRRKIMQAESKPLMMLLRETMQAFRGGVPLVDAEFLPGRGEELYQTIYGLGVALGLPEESLSRIRIGAVALEAEKTVEARSNTDLKRKGAEQVAQDLDYAQRAVVSLSEALSDGEELLFLPSAEAVTRLRAMELAPWRGFKGDGLTALALAGLVERMGLAPTDAMVKGVPNIRGYRAVDIAESLRRIGQSGKADELTVRIAAATADRQARIKAAQRQAGKTSGRGRKVAAVPVAETATPESGQ